MFERRITQKPSLDLLTSFKDSFAQLPLYTSDAQILPATPALTSSAAEAAMSYHPGHFSRYEDNDDVPDTCWDSEYQLEWKPADAFDSRSPENNMGLFGGPSTPYQRTPNASSFLPQNMVQSGAHQGQPGLMTPISGTMSHSNSLVGVQNFMNLPEYQMQHMPNAYDMRHFGPYSMGAPNLRPNFGFDAGQGSVDPQSLGVAQQEDHTPAMYSPENSSRFRATLKNGTAMFRDTEPPHSYLNKRQPYWINIQDTRPDQQQFTGPVTYRTSIRVTLDNRQLRESPEEHWKHFIKTRGKDEAQKRNQKVSELLAAEYLPYNQTSQSTASIVLRSQSFDGFTITWTTSARQPTCDIQLRFHFLSTDFTSAKGIKGTPMRLCAKTEVVDSRSMAPPSAEMYYCKIQLFRDHGAERKLHNDESHVKKQMFKLEEQIKQSHADYEEGRLHGPKRKRADSLSMAGRQSKLAKHRRTSASSNSSADITSPIGEDLKSKLDRWRRELNSKMGETILDIKAEDIDDPDKHPLPSDLVEKACGESMHTELADDRTLSRRSTQVTSISDDRSPSTGVLSANSPNRQSIHRLPTPMNTLSKSSSNDCRYGTKYEDDSEFQPTNPQHLASPPDNPHNIEHRPITRAKVGDETQNIEVIEADPSYNPPAPRKRQPVACFYVRASTNGRLPPNPYYRAIYLFERKVDAFMRAVALKHGKDPTDVKEIVRIKTQSHDRESPEITIVVDDEVIAEMVEGQDLLADFTLSSPQDHLEQQASRAHYILTLRY